MRTYSLAAVGIYGMMAYTVMVLILLGVAFVACYLPARRAARSDPALTLRSG